MDAKRFDVPRGGGSIAGAARCWRASVDWLQSGIPLHSAADYRRHPVSGAAGQSDLDRLTLKFMNFRNRREALTIAQAVDIDYGSCARWHFRDRRDEDTATATDQKIAGAGSKAIILDERPVICANLE